MPWVYDVWEMRALLRRQDSDQSSPRPRRRRPSPVCPPPSCFQQAAHSSNGEAPCNSRPQPSHPHPRRPSSLPQVPRSCFKQAAAQSDPSFCAANSADALHSPKKSKAHQRRAYPQVPASAFQQQAASFPAATVPGVKPRGSRSSRRQQASRPPTSCFCMKPTGSPHFEAEVANCTAGHQPAAHATLTASSPLDGRQAAGITHPEAHHFILPVMFAEPCKTAPAGIASQPEVPAATDAAAVCNLIACTAASEPDDATHDPSAPDSLSFSFQSLLPVSGPSPPGLSAARTWWMSQVGIHCKGAAPSQSTAQTRALDTAKAGIEQEIDACFPGLSTLPTSNLSSTVPASSDAASHFDGDAYLFKDGWISSISAGRPADQFDGDAFLFKDASSPTYPMHASSPTYPMHAPPATSQPEIVQSSSSFSFQPVHAADAATICSWPFCSISAPVAQA